SGLKTQRKRSSSACTPWVERPHVPVRVSVSNVPQSEMMSPASADPELGFISVAMSACTLSGTTCLRPSASSRAATHVTAEPCALAYELQRSAQAAMTLPVFLESTQTCTVPCVTGFELSVGVTLLLQNGSQRPGPTQNSPLGQGGSH